jgi:PKD repeat protein
VRLSFLVGLLMVVVAAAAAPSVLGVSGSDTITTVAGTGTAGYSGDGGQATSTQLNYPLGVTVDAQGIVYVADTSNNRVRKITGGIITTIAGTGTAGFAGDGGQATSAQLNVPGGVAVDAQGNVYIADEDNHRVRKVSGGIITTIAGTGVAGYSGDGGQATSALLNFPHGVTVDAQGNVFIVDTDNHRVRKVDSAGNITTVAGNGTAGFAGDGGQATSAELNFPRQVAVDAQENLYIADTDNHRVRKVSGGIITTFAGTGVAGFSGDGGQATSALLNFPRGVALDAAGNLYISEDNHRIRKVTGGIITTIAGTGVAGFAGDGGAGTSAQLDFPWGLAVDANGNLYIGDEYNHRVREIENKLPTASFTAAPTSGRAPLAVRFDGSASSDPDGSITAYAWAFGDGGTATGATAIHRYTTAGAHAAKLTVTDDSGATATSTQTITVTLPPKLTSSTVSAGKAHAGKSFTASMTVKDARTGKGVKGTVSCTGKLAGNPLAPSHHSSSANGQASCTWQLPKSAVGKQFTGSIAESYKGVKVSRSFSAKVV